MLPRTHQNVQAKTERMKAFDQLIAKTQQIIENVSQSSSTTEYLQWLHWWSNIKKIIQESNEEVQTTANFAIQNHCLNHKWNWFYR